MLGIDLVARALEGLLGVDHEAFWRRCGGIDVAVTTGVHGSWGSDDHASQAGKADEEMRKEHGC
jgi:hypothetical protein